MLSYFDYLRKANGVVYSVDMLRFRFYCCDVIKSKIRDFLYLNSFDYDIYQSAKSFNYAVLLQVKCNDSLDSFVVGLGFNGLKKSESRSCFIQFNPNKVGNSLELTNLLNYMSTLGITFDLVLYDIAIDIPIAKNYISLIKDSRVYKKFVYDSAGINCTEYLGTSADSGRVKLYNKTIESRLSTDVTRLELTTRSLDYIVVARQLPKLMFFGFSDIVEPLKLSDTDYVLLELLWQSNDPSYYFRRLGRRKQNALLPYVSNNFDIGFDEVVFTFLQKIINFFKNFKKVVDN